MTHRTIFRTRRAHIAERSLYSTLRSISMFIPGTYGLLSDDRDHLINVRKLEAKKLARTALIEGVVMVNLTARGWVVSGRQPQQLKQAA